jgi:hypothetical protein
MAKTDAVVLPLEALTAAVAELTQAVVALRQNLAGPGPGPGAAEQWDELSVVELRALLRSLPVDRRSLPAAIEVMRRQELLEALRQLQSLAPWELRGR